MNPQESERPQPVAYDADGLPLYHHPPQPAPAAPAPGQLELETSSGLQSHVTTKPESIDGQNFNPRIRTQYANEPEVVHTTRPIEPQRFEMSDELRTKHEASKERYPYLNLSPGEFVILDIKRHPIGLFVPAGITSALLVGIFTFTAFYPMIYDASVGSIMPSINAMFGFALLLAAIVVLSGAVALWVYLQNQFFMTNESVIQEIQESLFSRHEQTVSLGSIEDASFRQTGILQTVLNYGTIRLSTEGQETTYLFHYVSNPKKQIAILNNAIEDFKNGRPVWDND